LRPTAQSIVRAEGQSGRNQLTHYPSVSVLRAERLAMIERPGRHQLPEPFSSRPGKLMSDRLLNTIGRHVASRLLLRRREAGLTQQMVADAIGELARLGALRESKNHLDAHYATPQDRATG
jgi:hypothetical protein